MSGYPRQKQNLDLLRSPTLLDAANTPMKTIGYVKVSKRDQEIAGAHAMAILEALHDGSNKVDPSAWLKYLPKEDTRFSKREYLIRKNRRW